jgi:hypothetical protein
MSSLPEFRLNNDRLDREMIEKIIPIEYDELKSIPAAKVKIYVKIRMSQMQRRIG